MCTIFAAIGQDPRYPLIVAANRDERLDRPSSDYRLWDGSPGFIAPVDEQAGGSWIGLNAVGVFAAITNRFLTPRHPERRSRGELVTSVLRLRSAAEIHEDMKAVKATDYNAFHLFYADSKHAFVSWTDGETITHEACAPGVHVLTERSFAKEPASRAERLRGMWSALPEKDDPRAVFDLLRVHADDDPFSGTCIHAPAFNYGTRSSTVLLLSPDLARSRLLTSEGPAHAATPADRAELLRALTAGE